MKRAEDFNWYNELERILIDYKEDWEEPLDGDEVDTLIEILRAKLNLIEGNITEEEYDKILEEVL